MAILIDIEKLDENDEVMTFKYWQDAKGAGRFVYHKTTHEFDLLEASEGERDERAYVCAKRRVSQSLKETGHVPDKLMYAA